MTISFRSALAFCAALAVTGMAPAQAGSGQAIPQLVATATLPKVLAPDLLSIEDEPQLTGGETPGSPQTSTDSTAQGADEVVEQSPTVSGTLSEMVAKLRATETGSREMDCLATGIYFESKGEPLNGQLAVGHVIANRAKSGRFPSSYCGVLFQRGQFSFIRGKSLPSAPRSSGNWKTAVAIAKIVDGQLKKSEIGNALFFHARYVSPGWRLKRIASIGNHVFYR